LKVKPETLRHAEVEGESESGVGRNSSLPMHDFIDATWRDRDVLGKPILAYPHRLEEFLEEYFSRMNRWLLSSTHVPAP
jgi:hypothetical protein